MKPQILPALLSQLPVRLLPPTHLKEGQHTHPLAQERTSRQLLASRRQPSRARVQGRIPRLHLLSKKKKKKKARQPRNKKENRNKNYGASGWIYLHGMLSSKILVRLIDTQWPRLARLDGCLRLCVPVLGTPVKASPREKRLSLIFNLSI